MAVSVYDQQFLTDEQRKQLKAITEEWNRASAAGDRAAMDSAHAAAERIRATAGYGGGADGSLFLPSGEGYRPAGLTGYRAQTEAVDRLYDAARDKKLAELKTAFDESGAALEAEREAIPGLYQSGRNATAAQSELAGRNFKEYAAASGLNSGTAGQAELARSIQLQGDIGELNAQESQAEREILRQQTELRTKYANDIATAIADGEYKRAEALLGEYRKAEESRVSTARDQADENYRAYESGVAAAKTAADERSAERKAQEERAERLAGFGNFSGYTDLGYTDEEIANMKRAWVSKNPLTAYYTGAITRDEYLRLMKEKG